MQFNKIILRQKRNQQSKPEKVLHYVKQHTTTVKTEKRSMINLNLVKLKNVFQVLQIFNEY